LTICVTQYDKKGLEARQILTKVWNFITFTVEMMITKIFRHFCRNPWRFCWHLQNCYSLHRNGDTGHILNMHMICLKHTHLHSGPCACAYILGNHSCPCYNYYIDTYVQIISLYINKSIVITNIHKFTDWVTLPYQALSQESSDKPPSVSKSPLFWNKRFTFKNKRPTFILKCPQLAIVCLFSFFRAWTICVFWQ